MKRAILTGLLAAGIGAMPGCSADAKTAVPPGEAVSDQHASSNPGAPGDNPEQPLNQSESPADNPEQPGSNPDQPGGPGGGSFDCSSLCAGLTGECNAACLSDCGNLVQVLGNQCGALLQALWACAAVAGFYCDEDGEVRAVGGACGAEADALESCLRSLIPDPTPDPPAQIPDPPRGPDAGF